MNTKHLEFERFLLGDEPLKITGANAVSIHNILEAGIRTGMPKGSPLPEVHFALRDLNLEERSVVYFRDDLTPINFKASARDLDRLDFLLRKELEPDL